MAKKLSRDAVLKRKATAKVQEIPDGGAAGLRLVIQPTNGKSFSMRFRRPGGKAGNLVLGPFDPTDRKACNAPVIGQPLTVPEAHALAASINLQRARGIDVIAIQQAGRRRQPDNTGDPKQSAFPAHVLDFIRRHARPKTRRWRETARMLGYDFPLDGGPETIVKRGLVDRWCERLPSEIDGDDIYGLIDEARHRGIPGLGMRGKAPSEARARKMADTLSAVFGWLHEHRRIKMNPCLGVHRPDAPSKGSRALNVKIDVRNADELRWFWAACDQIGSPFGALCKVLLLSGCRREEIAQMTVEELNTDNTMLRLPGTRTKNHLPHDVPMPALEREIIAGVPRVSNHFVFSTNSVRPISGFSKYKKRLDKLMLAEAKKERGEKAVIPGWKIHDLRRTTATGMAGIGIPPHVIEVCLNHVSGSKAGVAGTYNRETYLAERDRCLRALGSAHRRYCLW